MQSSTMTRNGGYALVVGAILYVVAVFLLTPAEGEAVANEALGRWLQALASFAVLAGVIAALRGWGGSESESWAVMTVAAVIVGTALLMNYAQGELSDSIGRGVSWLGLAALGAAVLMDAGWPKWVAWTGILIGLLEFIAEFVLEYGPTLRIVWLVGFLWLIIAGVFMSRAGATPAAAPAAAPGGPGGPGM